MDSAWGPRGLAEAGKVRTRINRTRGLGRMTHEEYEDLHKLINQLIAKLNRLKEKYEDES